MNHTDKQLMACILAFEIDDGPAAYPFADRLASEAGWSRDYADRAITEYKRFLVLGALAGHPVTPSQAVDEVWHLHLTYTVSYWDRLCRDLLRRPFHHHPTKGGDVEEAKFDSWYTRTRARYAEIFNEAPPEDIWPDPTRPSSIRIQTQRPSLRILARWAAVVLLSVTFGAILGATAHLAAASPLMLAASDIGGYISFGCIFLFVAWIIYRFRGGGGRGGRCSSGCGGGCGGADCGGGCGGGCGGD